MSVTVADYVKLSMEDLEDIKIIAEDALQSAPIMIAQNPGVIEDPEWCELMQMARATLELYEIRKRRSHLGVVP